MNRNLAWISVKRLVAGIFGGVLHHLQLLSLALITFGVVRADRLGVAAVGRAMARSRGTFWKHGIKQVDRFLSNAKLPPKKLWPALLRAVVGNRTQVLVTMDWTDFDADDQTTLVLSLVTRSHRAQPLVWRTVRKSALAGRRSAHERALLLALRRALPHHVGAIILADRGFGDTALYAHLAGIPGFDFVVRFRSCIHVRSAELRGKARHFVPRNGRRRVVQYAMLTRAGSGPYTVVLYKAAGMKDSWCLATSLPTDDGRDIIAAYAHRFECEEAFRDAKDRRFGLGLKQARIGTPKRRDRMILVFVLAYLVLTLAGAASEQVGADRMLRANTERGRTHSLFRQGREMLDTQGSSDLLARVAGALRRRISALLTHGAAHALA
jgi:hypothetical protein